MPGIRIQQPIGPDWEYSLDGQTWQKQPLFNTKADGSAFTPGKSYPVQARNLKLGRLAVGNIVFGDLTNEGQRQLPDNQRYGRGSLLKPGLPDFSDDFSDDFD